MTYSFGFSCHKCNKYFEKGDSWFYIEEGDPNSYDVGYTVCTKCMNLINMIKKMQGVRDVR